MPNTNISALPSGQAIGGTTVSYKNTTAHGAIYELKSAEELLTLSTGGTTTDLTFTLPTHSIPVAISYRVTTSITTATSWTPSIVGIGTLNDVVLASSTITNLTAGDTGTLSVVGLGPFSAAKTIRVTAQATPGAGAIRFAIFYLALTPPTS